MISISPCLPLPHNHVGLLCLTLPFPLPLHIILCSLCQYIFMIEFDTVKISNFHRKGHWEPPSPLLVLALSQYLTPGALGYLFSEG